MRQSLMGRSSPICIHWSRAFGQSQKELEKALHEDGDLTKARQLKARIDFFGEASDLKKIRRFLEELKDPVADRFRAIMDR